MALTLYCATTNSGKLREFRMAASGGVDIQPLPELALIPPCDETGHTFEENAIGKTRYYGAYCDGYLFAEDSGLAVTALDGAPGVYSARFAGVNADDDSNNRLLLKRLEGVKDRTARYVCAIALTHKGELLRTFLGEVEGTILEGTRGHGGFGYDPLFYYRPFGGTFAEIPLEQKQTVSHRGRALRLMLSYVQAHPASA
jgi:XTP/dITP diphosphohydrolase